VRDEHHGLADLLLKPEELVLEPVPVDRVDRPERLVHQHQRRIHGKRSCHADPLALATGELRRIAVARVGGIE
jgi:hypothetical protein